MTVREILSSPLTWLTALVSTFAGWVGMLDVVFQFLSSTAGTWFPAVAVFATTIADFIPQISAQTAQTVLLVAALVYFGILAERWADSAVAFFKDNDK